MTPLFLVYKIHSDWGPSAPEMVFCFKLMYGVWRASKLFMCHRTYSLAKLTAMPPVLVYQKQQVI